jgi:glucosamine-6-phosphate deaminase
LRVIIESSPEAASHLAANLFTQLIQAKPNCVLGLATGSTPERLYRELIRRHQEEDVSFARVTTFNLDEYVGLPPGHPQSYRSFMHGALFSHIDVEPANTHIPDGHALDLHAACRSYEQKIRDAGGIDLQVLGIGGDGHIAFNEPGSSLGSRTRIKALARETIRDNARFFGSEELVPRIALTMGVGTILESRACVLLAFGESKAKAIAAAVEGPVTSQVTASALQLHRDVSVILDEAAASQLTRKDYYRDVENVQRMLEAGKRQQFGVAQE